MIANVFLDRSKEYIISKEYINYLVELETLNYLKKLNVINQTIYDKAILYLKKLYIGK